MRRAGTLVIAAVPALGAIVLAAGAVLDPRPILLESLESKTAEGSAVFNRIRWMPGRERDVWMMQQSHSGLAGDPDGSWDRLAIVVDRGATPTRARFFQVVPGPLRWAERLREVPYRAACFTCHPNGPRAIRPTLDSASGARLSAWDRARLLAWNLRIKTYGRIEPHPAQEPAMEGSPSELSGKAPFRYAGAGDNERILLRSCTRCHNDSRWGRGFLTRQNAFTIRFMLRNEFMPPPGFGVSDDDRRALDRLMGTLPAS